MNVNAGFLTVLYLRDFQYLIHVWILLDFDATEFYLKDTAPIIFEKMPSEKYTRLFFHRYILDAIRITVSRFLDLTHCTKSTAEKYTNYLPQASDIYTGYIITPGDMNALV